VSRPLQPGQLALDRAGPGSNEANQLGRVEAPLRLFVLSRVNGDWDVQSILKLCPMNEENALLIFARLLEGKVIQLR
jgi:hypothetical protein